MTQIQFKPEVRLDLTNLRPWIVRILRGAVETAPPLQGDVLVVTSASDGKHMAGSLHYAGMAFDLRCYGMREGAISTSSSSQAPAAEAWVRRLRAWLGAEYDVLLEADHIHVERDIIR